MNETRSSNDFILSLTCESCWYVGYGWYSELRAEHKEHSPSCFQADT